MKIKFEKIIIHNFLSFGHAELSLKNKGFSLIEGINNNPLDSANSNGSGKSSIFSALCFALTGETIQGISSNLRNMFIPNEDMYVDLIFYIDNTKYEIIRSRDSKDRGNLRFLVNDEDKSGKGLRETESILNSFIPSISSDLLGEVIIIGQGMPHKFSNNTPSGRKDLLEKLSNSDVMLADIKMRVENRVNVLKERMQNIQNELISLNTTKDIKEKYKISKLEELEKYKNKPDFDLNIQKIEAELNKQNTDLNILKTNKDQLEHNMQELNENLTSLYSNESKLKEEETQLFNEANLTIKTDISKKTIILDNLNKEIFEKENIKDICPLCGQKLPHVHKYDVTPLKNEKVELEESLKILKIKDNSQNESYKLNLEEIEKTFKENKLKLNSEIIEIKTKLEELKNNINSINLIINQLNINKISEEDKKKFFEENHLKVIEELNSLESEISDLSSKILYNISEQEKTQNKLDVVTKMSTFVKRDFRGILLLDVINYIDSKAKEYSNEIFGTTELSFELNGNNINISYLGKSLESLSGGERQKVDLIMQFAIRSMMQEYTGFSSNILVLDEILDNLDVKGCDSILNFITNKLSDIESIFIISHHADTLNIGNDSIITVIKDSKGVSQLYEK